MHLSFGPQTWTVSVSSLIGFLLIVVTIHLDFLSLEAQAPLVGHESRRSSDIPGGRLCVERL